MILLYSSQSDDPVRWRAALSGLIPELDFRIWPDAVGDPNEIEYALVWKPEIGMLGRYPNLRAILSLGAGVDHIFRDPGLPAGVPVVRLIDRALTSGMVEYVLYWTLHFHRDFHLYAEDQRQGHWQPRRPPDTSRRRVGILGLGVLGRGCTAPLVALGFDVAGWSRTAKEVAGVESFHGDDGLMPFLERSDILVCLLPLTAATDGILDARAFAALPAGAVLINAARGGHVVDEALLAALDSGHMAGAALDVFHNEPLPPDHLYWHHPKIVITPHVASTTVTASAAIEIAANLRRLEAGEIPAEIVDPERGY